jgi:hypothetical protein
VTSGCGSARPLSREGDPPLEGAGGGETAVTAMSLPLLSLEPRGFSLVGEDVPRAPLVHACCRLWHVRHSCVISNACATDGTRCA